MPNMTIGDILLRSQGSIKTGPFGTKLAAREYSNRGAPVISVGEIGYGRITVTDRTKRVGTDVTDRMPEYLLKAGDIVFGRKGGVDRSAWVRPHEEGYFLGSDGIRLRFGQRVDSRFMAYQFQTPRVRNWLLQHAIGTTLPSLNEPTLRAVPVELPSFPVQRSISATLGSLDSKIESGERAVGLLRELVQLQFRRILENEHYALVPLAELASIVKGRSYKSAELQPSPTALVTLRSVDRNGGYREDGLKPYVGPFKPEQVVCGGEVVVAQTDLTQGAEVVGRAVRVPPISQFETLVASLDLAIVRPLGSQPIEYLYALLSSEAFRQHCRSHTTGTTVLHLAKDAIPTWRAPVVSQESQQAYAALVRPLLARMDVLRDEASRLRDVRDALLPELLSGRIRVPEATEAVEEAVG